jgi:hypothetical protein
VLFLQEINVAEGEMEFTIDLRPFMNRSPYTVQHVSTAESVFISGNSQFNALLCHNSLLVSAVRVKAVPLQAWTGPEGSRRLRLPVFKTIDT